MVVELDLAPMRNHDRLDVICKLCGKSFKQITGVAEQALKGGDKGMDNRGNYTKDV